MLSRPAFIPVVADACICATSATSLGGPVAKEPKLLSPLTIGPDRRICRGAEALRQSPSKHVRRAFGCRRAPTMPATASSVNRAVISRSSSLTGRRVRSATEPGPAKSANCAGAMPPPSPNFTRPNFTRCIRSSGTGSRCRSCIPACVIEPEVIQFRTLQMLAAEIDQDLQARSLVLLFNRRQAFDQPVRMGKRYPSSSLRLQQLANLVKIFYLACRVTADADSAVRLPNGQS